MLTSFYIILFHLLSCSFTSLLFFTLSAPSFPPALAFLFILPHTFSSFIFIQTTPSLPIPFYYYLFVIIVVNHRYKKDVNLAMDVDVNYESTLIDTTKVVASNYVTKRRKKVLTALPSLPKSYIWYITCIISNMTWKTRIVVRFARNLLLLTIPNCLFCPKHLHYLLKHPLMLYTLQNLRFAEYFIR